MTIAEINHERHCVTPGRLLVTGLSVASGCALPIATWAMTYVMKPNTWTIAGDLVSLWALNLALFAVTIACEVVVYDSFARNWKSARTNGFSGARILAHAITLFFLSGWVPIAMVAYEGNQAHPHLDVALLLRLGVAVALTDVLYFRYVHQAMHRYVPDVHMLHHICFVPSFSTNFFFNILDFVAEFGGPLIGAFAAFKTDLIGQKDPFAFLLLAGFVQLFYVLDHDRLIQNEHYRHHTLLNCNYFVYNQRTQPRDAREQFRGLLKRNAVDKLA